MTETTRWRTLAAMRVFTDKCQDLQWVDVTSETSVVAEKSWS